MAIWKIGQSSLPLISQTPPGTDEMVTSLRPFYSRLDYLFPNPSLCQVMQKIFFAFAGIYDSRIWKDVTRKTEAHHI